jgi:hypothetical protein
LPGAIVLRLTQGLGIFTLLALGSVGAVERAESPATPNLGLVAHYPFDGDLQDHSGFQRHAVSDFPGSTQRFSLARTASPNQALSLSGRDAGLTIPSLAGFGPNGNRGATISFWMRCPIQGIVLGCARESAPDQSSFHVRTDGKHLMVSGGVGDEVGFGFPESPNAWRHVAVVFGRSGQEKNSGMEVRLWVDGRSIGFCPIEVNPRHLRTPLTVGGVSGMTHGGLQGEIDDLRLYGRALSLEEVLDLYARDTMGLGAVPVLVLQPQAQSMEKGRDVTFRVAVRNDEPCQFQWQLNQTNLPGATRSELTLSNLPPSLDGGRYRVLVQNGSGATFSESALLTVFPLSPPSVLSQPTSVEVAEGEPEVVFQVACAGSGVLSCQWQFNGKNLPQGTGERLVLRHVRPFADGRYRVRVTNPYGSVWSDEVRLTVNSYDADEDGLSDYEELLLKTDPEKPDYYGDRLPPIPSPEISPWQELWVTSNPSSQGKRSMAVAVLQILLRMSHIWWGDW